MLNPSIKFILFINVKMSTIVSILTSEHLFAGQLQHLRVLKPEKSLFFCIVIFIRSCYYEHDLEALAGIHKILSE